MTMNEDGCPAGLRQHARQLPKAYVIFEDGARVDVEVANSDIARARGLMYRQHLGEDEGMLFPFDVPRRYAFWMKNVRFALDIIWLDASGRIVSIARRAEPCAQPPCLTYVPDQEASTVLEVLGGFVERHRIAVGDAVQVIGQT